jgi:hemerythrin-like domain-containing protein
MPENLDGNRSLKRHEALLPLSRDHHFALIYALSLRRAAEAPLGAGRGAVATAESFLSFYDEELLGHMADEEEALLPLATEASPEGASRLVAEHEDIRERTAILRQALEEGGDPRGPMKDIGDLLHDHVRFEERVLFETFQSGLSETQLLAIRRALDDHRSARGRGEGCTLLPAGIILPARASKA